MRNGGAEKDAAKKDGQFREGLNNWLTARKTE